jgi:hypothetical protein
MGCPVLEITNGRRKRKTGKGGVRIRASGVGACNTIFMEKYATKARITRMSPLCFPSMKPLKTASNVHT